MDGPKSGAKGNPADWRSAILLEAGSGTRNGIRTIGTSTTNERKYVKYGVGARELCDLDSDPHELVNRYAAGKIPAVVLASRLAELKGCVGDGCRAVENGE
jgi:hypothetical protein